MDHQATGPKFTPNSKRRSPVASSASTSKPSIQYRPPAWLRYNTGQETKSIISDSLTPDPAQVDSSSGVETLCSYNWQDAAEPTIYVPGAPPKWLQPDLPVTLPEDKAGRFIDQNAHRCPAYPFEPMFRAIHVMKPDFNFNNVDFITNRNSMRKLLDFVGGKVWDPFRIDLDMIHDTLVFTRRERRTKEAENDSRSNLGFGINFEHKFTVSQEGLEASTGHHRVTKYKFGDLDCAVRYEVDAYLAYDGQAKGDLVEASASDKKQGHDQDDLLSSLQALSLRAKEQEKNSRGPKRREVKVIAGGTSIDGQRLAELKTKAKPPVMTQLVPQLWFGRVPFLIVGRHQNGTFEKITTTETAGDFEKFEKLQQVRLRKLVQLIKLLKQETISSPGRACVVICEPKVKPLRLTILTVKNKKPVLPPELIKQHWTTEDARESRKRTSKQTEPALSTVSEVA